MNVVQMPNQDQELVLTFDDFWNLYPRRVAKKEARHAWNKITPKQHSLILSALYEWARIWKDRGEPEYIPYPATWLNGERWEDDFPTGHRVYTPPVVRLDTERRQEEAPRVAMPAHVIDAIKKKRQ